MKIPKILFVSPYIPYEKAPITKDNLDYFYYRNTFAQDFFQIRQMHNWHPLHYIANNIGIPSIVLENMTFKEFTDEIKTNDYDVVAISFTSMLSDRVLHMIRWIKNYNSDIDVILGGYGTSIFGEKKETDILLSKYSDYICIGEGIKYFRNYLMEKWGIKDINDSINPVLPITKNSFFRTHIPLFDQMNFILSLGCPHRCMFCATSGHYSQKKIKLSTPEKLFNSIKHNALIHKKINSAIIYDENFLDDKEFVLEFMKYMEKDEELMLRPVLLTVFSSVSSVMKYSIEELIKCGIGTIFIGVESFDENILKKMNKRSGGNIEKLFRDLHNNGINTLGSMVVGWDEHTKSNILKDVSKFISLNPTFYQVIPLHPLPGTPLWEEMKTQGRIKINYKFEEDGVYQNSFTYKNFTQKEIQKMVFYIYRKLVLTGGPWPLRLSKNLLSGYLNFQDSNNIYFKRRAIAYEKLLKDILPLTILSGIFFNGSFKQEWRNIINKLYKINPGYFIYSVFKSFIFIPVLAIINIFGYILFYLNPHGDQPDKLRKEYNKYKQK